MFVSPLNILLNSKFVLVNCLNDDVSAYCNVFFLILFKVHMQIHEPDNTDLSKPFYCNVCDARSSDMNLMVRHRAIHTDEKPFQCQHCDYKTRWKKDLKTHELIHTGQYVHS